MAFKQGIPQNWIQRQPNVAKLPHIYNLDDAVGLNCPNKRLDVMLIQFMLLAWATGTQYGMRDNRAPAAILPIGWLPANGAFDNRLLAWIFHYQLKAWKDDIAGITGKVLPARADGSSLGDSRHMLFRLNLDLAGPDYRDRFRGVSSQWWLDMAAAPGVPTELAQALKQTR